jgi:RNA polymerase sigma factor (TIGR02999 family)
VVQSSTNRVTELLAKWRAGDQAALDALVPLVYCELRDVAHRHLRHERPNHTLQSTALVHEAYLRLRKQGEQGFENRAHFVAVAAQLMRQILVEFARRRNAAKRNRGDTLALDDDSAVFSRIRSGDMLALDDALNDLGRLDPRQSKIVELRFFGGLSIDETAAVMGVSPATVKRDWTTARVWLHRQLNRSG